MIRCLVRQTTPPDPCWVLGSGGLLGQAIVRRLGSRSFVGQRYSWADVSMLSTQFEHDVQTFRRRVEQMSHSDGTWGVIWACGRGMVGASQIDLAQESMILNAFLKALQQNRPLGRGVLFFASSAGAVYAGSRNPPFTESTIPVATSAYGEEKLLQENTVQSCVTDGLFSQAVIGRIANLYGVGQDLTKPQGLITHLCLAAAKRTTVNLFVSLDTRRHYIESSDAAEQIVASLARAAKCPTGTCQVKIISNGDAVTVGGLVRTVRRVARRPVRVASGLDARSTLQPMDLRLKSEVWSSSRASCGIPLIIGVSGVMRDIDARIATGSLASSGN